MPLLDKRGTAVDSIAEILRQTLAREAPGARTVEPEPKRGRWLETCANQACRTGWMQVWRSRSAPVFEGGWTCSEACMATRMRQAVLRECKGRAEARPPHRHRLPLGLLMLEQGWVTAEQLRGALESQRKHGAGRLGSWLVKQHGVSEETVTRALAMQWSCPVLSVRSQHPAQLASFVPRLFVDAFGAVPLRLAAGKVLYLGFEDRLDPVLARAVERMTGIRAECGVVTDSEFAHAHARMLRADYPAVELIEAVHEEALTRALTRAIERAKPVSARLVRVHEFLWLRMSRQTEGGAAAGAEGVQDVIGTISGQ
jgi:hypothetical protein